MSQHIKCECGALFGIEQADGTLAIKYRDLFRIVRGTVSGPCRKCGAPVTWPSAPYTIPSSHYQVPPWTWAAPAPMPATYSCNCTCAVCTSGSCCQVPT